VLSQPPTPAEIERIVDRQMEDLRRDELVVTWREERQAATTESAARAGAVGASSG
jgi:hypothetical protein